MPAMPIRDNGLDTMGEMDSNGSCDSVLSFNSCLSDESLEYLSAEEKACLMYLEETIQSLDMEDDSGLSNDESDRLPARGNVANKAAHLSASMLKKLPSQDVPKSQSGPLLSSLEQNSEILNYMVPTPFVLANRNSQIQTKPRLATSQKKTSPKLTSHQKAPQIPSEINVVVIPPPIKVKTSKDTEKEQQNNAQPENVSRRGPLSYEALVQLRKSGSMKKSEEQQVFPNRDLEGNTSGSQTLTPNSQPMISRGCKSTPPPVAPKPKMKISPLLNQEGASNPKSNSAMPYSGVLTADKLMNPEKVRVEALCKLGILKKDTNIQNCQQVNHSQSNLGQTMNQTVQSNPFHQRSVSDLSAAFPRPHADFTSSGKSATLERTGMGLSGSNATGNSLNTRSRSSTVGGNDHLNDTQMDSTPRKAAFHVSSSQYKGFNVPVPSIGKDRREALRKLGLLKN